MSKNFLYLRVGDRVQYEIPNIGDSDSDDYLFMFGRIECLYTNPFGMIEVVTVRSDHGLVFDCHPDCIIGAEEGRFDD